MATKTKQHRAPNQAAKAGFLSQLSKREKREYFAGFALAGLLARGTVERDAPKLAVAAADLLIAELNGSRSS